MTTNHIFGASYERGVELKAAGCPLDYLDVLAHSEAKRKRFRVKEITGYAETCVFVFNPQRIGFAIALALDTDRSAGTIITNWTFEPPWPNHQISWDYEPQDIIPERHLEAYKSLLKSRLTEVLNDRRLLRRGYPVRGLLCGCAFQPIPEPGDGAVSGELVLVDDIGNVVATRINLAVVRPAASRRVHRVRVRND